MANPGRNKPQPPKGGSKKGVLPSPPKPPEPPKAPYGLFGSFVRSLRRAAGKLIETSKPKLFEEVAQLYTATTQDLRTDAAFSASEEFAFLLGEKINTRGWITAAQWFPSEESMKLWCGQYGPYDFPGIQIADARVFAKADSKGGWYWGIWKGRATVGTVKKGAIAEWKRGRVGVATPIFGQVIRKK